MSNKVEATFHGKSAWDMLDDYSDEGLSKSDVSTALDVLGGQYDVAALRTLTIAQLTGLASASHARSGSRTEHEVDSIKAYQEARRRFDLPTTAERDEAEDSRNAAEFAADMHRAAIDDGIRSLVTISGENSRDHGFHEDWPDPIEHQSFAWPRAVQLALAEKLALQHEEVSESLGEIRSGRDPLEIYFVDKKGAIGPVGAEYGEQRYEVIEGVEDPVPLLKPEGFLVEQADVMIRVADTAFLVDGRAQLVKALAIKHEYNKTRPYKHGRKF